MSVRAEKAAKLFGSGFNCAQSVLLAFARELGMDEKAAARISCPFGAGMGRAARTCGAVSGALMAIGLRHGMEEPADLAAKEKAYALAREFLARFQARHGAIACRDLLGCDIGTPDGFARMRAEGMHGKVCAPLVRDAVELAEGLLGMGHKGG